MTTSLLPAVQAFFQRDHGLFITQGKLKFQIKHLRQRRKTTLADQRQFSLHP